MRLASILVFGLVSLAASETAFAQPFWREKDFHQWSEKECRKLLEDSPWARRFTHSRTYIEPMGTRTRDRELQENPRLEYIAQVHSALPIRQALVRLKQLEAHYDELSPEQKKVFDQQGQQFLSKAFPDVLVIYVAYGSNVMTYNREMARHWQALPPETAKKQILLVAPRGRRIYPLTYTALGGGGGAFQVTFPKQTNGEPLLTPQDKEMKLEFPHPNIGQQGDANVSIAFDLRKMTVDGKILY